MKGKMFLICCLIIFGIISCKKDNEATVTPPVASRDFLNLKIGNYWIYAFYKVDTNGVETPFPGTDSSYISGDTVINGISYFIKLVHFTPWSVNQPPDTIIVRDSSGTLLAYLGPPYPDRILFSRDNYSDVLYSESNTISHSETRMTGKDSLVMVPAGSFVTRSSCLTIFPLDPEYPWGIRKFYSIYGENTGLIKSTTAYYDQPYHFESRLIRFKQ